MFVESIVLKRFRNYDNLEIEFSEGTNFIVGPNGSGKTNILEAISVAANIRSFRGAADSEMVKWGEESYFCGLLLGDSPFRQIEIGYASSPGFSRKKAKVDGREIHRVQDYFGRLLTVIYSPCDILILNGAPELRRRFFDAILARIDREYLSMLGEFRKILSSRNRLLKSIADSRGTEAELDVWDNMLAESSYGILKKRMDFISSFTPSFRDAYSGIAGGDSVPSLGYQCCFGDLTIQGINDKILGLRKKDIAAGTTTAGPHRDDYILYHENGRLFSACSSQGQKRTASIALKNAERISIEKATGERVVVMIDDVFSELDAERRENLVESLHGENQVIFTMVNTGSLDTIAFSNARMFKTGPSGAVRAE
ncbi:MAG TPA: DNA replication and repair protein RecF [Spirochaetota bacterium]|nr:DNA replication and repair protein RecF [Spirochaetota bacterium]HNU90908.1 DNA replication and repair protein RecF [Spirochaetota bacterium]HPV97153.1 DNA replication and repair protein RecF [Spirochaetota bacterium]